MRLDRRGVLAGAGALVAAGRAQAQAGLPPHPDPALWEGPRDTPVHDGVAPGPNGSVYFRLYGRAGARTPLVVLHGGPAAEHLYLRAYAHLAGDRQVVLYDQSGCGRSAAPADLGRYTLARYVAELETLRTHLGFERIALLGHSWGGMLAPAYADAHPRRVSAMVLAGTATRWRDFEDAAHIWLRELGPGAVAVVARARRTGRTDDPAYAALLQRYYALHLCRLARTPAWFDAEGERVGRNPVYRHLNGPSEFQFTGALAPLDGRAALRRVRVPTLVTCGEFDEAPAWVARRIAALVPGARLQVFDGLSHMSHMEDPVRVVGTTGAFLKSV